MTETELKTWLGDDKPVPASVSAGMRPIPVPRSPALHILAWMTYLQLSREAREKDTA